MHLWNVLKQKELENDLKYEIFLPSSLVLSSQYVAVVREVQLFYFDTTWTKLFSTLSREGWRERTYEGK